jgi:hypothetical protein
VEVRWSCQVTMFLCTRRTAFFRLSKAKRNEICSIYLFEDSCVVIVSVALYCLVRGAYIYAASSDIKVCEKLIVVVH